MDKVEGYEGDMETMLTYVDVNSLPGEVHFAAIRNDGNIAAVNDVTFSSTTINIGRFI